MQTWQIVALAFIGVCTLLTIFSDKILTIFRKSPAIVPTVTTNENIENKYILDGSDLCGVFNFLAQQVKDVPSSAMLEIREAIAKQVMPFESKE